MIAYFLKDKFGPYTVTKIEFSKISLWFYN